MNLGIRTNSVRLLHLVRPCLAIPLRKIFPQKHTPNYHLEILTHNWNCQRKIVYLYQIYQKIARSFAASFL